jgi:hypothetical protein
MREIIDDIAAKLIDAAYGPFGRPPEAGGIYIAEVTSKADVPACFRKMAELARAPRSMELWHHYQSMYVGPAPQSDAVFVMNAGLEYLSRDGTLPPAQRRVIETSRRSSNGSRMSAMS